MYVFTGAGGGGGGSNKILRRTWSFDGNFVIQEYYPTTLSKKGIPLNVLVYQIVDLNPRLFICVIFYYHQQEVYVWHSDLIMKQEVVRFTYHNPHNPNSIYID